MARNREDVVRARTDAARRYRRAAEEALNQLDWCVNYLHRIHKHRIAEVIDENRTLIREQMRGARD